MNAFTLPVDSYLVHHTQLVEIHHGIRGALESVRVDASLSVLVNQAKGAAGFLLGHHDAESLVLFPFLRERGRLRSTDVSFLAACDRAHEELHHVCDRLLAEANAPHPRGDELALLAQETLALFIPHTMEEETGLATDHLRYMIDAAGLVELDRRMDSFRRTSR